MRLSASDWTMSVRRLAALLGAGAACAFPASAAAPALENEFNAWPLVVSRPEATPGETWTGAGPFLFRQQESERTVRGFRPFWIEEHDKAGNFRSGHFLYPLFSYTTDETVRRWSVMELVRRIARRQEAGPPRSIFDDRREFEIWPFWFSREAGDPALSYRGLFPIAGTVRNKLGMERFSWLAFPLYAQVEKSGVVTTQTPWPFIRVTRGAAHGGGVWPLFTFVERPGVSREAHFLWPLGYNATRYPTPDDPPGTPARHDVGFLPFYARSTGPGLTNVSYFWPFFGYTDRTLPTPYQERRYFWPLLVQGRGPDRYVNRWGPFYTHSVIKGYDKHWFAWPIVRHAQWDEEGLRRTKTQVLYFLFSSQRQRSIARPELPAANLTHVWPLLSTWNNGAGRRQWQFLSPLEVFFPGQEQVRHAWTPFFALARHDERPGLARTSFLWNAVTWEQREHGNEFHVGPLFSAASEGERRRVAFGNGLFGFRRETTAGGWRMFWLEFQAKPATPARSSS
jgi:hypothetical protein